MSKSFREEMATFKAQLAENTRLTRETHEAVMGAADKPGIKGRLRTTELKVNTLWGLFTLGIPFMARQVWSTFKNS